jgi:hypothetical protein
MAEEGKQQALVFRVDKADIRATLVSLEARTGLKIQYQDPEARKGGKDDESNHFSGGRAPAVMRACERSRICPGWLLPPFRIWKISLPRSSR